MAYPAFNQVMGTNVNHSASNGYCRVKAESVIFIPLPRIEYPFGVYGSFINCTRNSHIYKLTAQTRLKISTTQANIETIILKWISSKLPEKNSVFCEVEEIIIIRINGKKLPQKRVIAKVTVDVMNI